MNPFVLSLISAVDQAVLGVLLASAVAAIPVLVPKAVGALNAYKVSKHNIFVDLAVNQGIAYFKAHEADFAKQGVQLVEFVVGHVQSRVPGISATQIEPVIELALSTLAKSV